MVKQNKSRALDRSGPVPEPFKRFQEFLALCELSLPEFYKESGFTRERVDNWFYRDKSLIPQRSWPEIKAVADRHNVVGLTLDWLNYEAGPKPTLKEAGEKPIAEVTELPGKVPDGLQRMLYLEGFSPQHTHHIDIYSSLLRNNLRLLEPHVRVAEFVGEAMRGKIEDGDLCFVDTRVTAFEQDDVYACQMGRFALIRRITKLATGVLRLQGTKPHEDSFDVLEEEMKSLRIRGRVIHVVGDKDFKFHS